MNYIVHSNNPTTVMVKATTEKGTEVEAPMPGHYIEMLPVDGGKTVTLELTQDNWNGLAPAEIGVGDTVALSLAIVAKADPAPQE